MNLANAAEDLLLAWLMTAGAATRPTSWFIGLHTADPGEDGTTGEVSTSGTGYARVSATFATPSGGSTATSNSQTFTDTGTDWGLIGWISIWTAVSGGSCLWKGPLGQAPMPFTATTADVITSPAHGFTNGQRVVFYAGNGGVLPTGITAGTLYYVISATTDTFQISTTSGGSAVDITASGDGIVQRSIPKQIGDGDQLVLNTGQVVISLD